MKRWWLAIPIVACVLWAIALRGPRPPDVVAEALDSRPAATEPVRTIHFAPPPIKKPVASAPVIAVPPLLDQDQALMANALKPEFWRDMSPEEQGRTIRHLAEIYPWPGGKPPFVPPPPETPAR